MERWLLITGAGQRIGAALAEHFAARGWNLVLHANRSQTHADGLAAQLTKAHGVRTHRVTCDLSDDHALADFWNGLPPVQALVHNAATFDRDTLAAMDIAVLHKQLQVNFIAPLLLTQGFMRQLAPDATGSVVILGDGVMGWSVSPEFFSYSVSKHAWVGTLDLLAAACAPRARVNLVALAPTLPGPTDTPELFERLAARAPLARTGTPHDVCHAVDYLMGAEGVTGQWLSLAGGMELATARPLP